MSSVAKVVELSADSDKSFKDALDHGVKRACKTLRNVSNVWVEDQVIIIKDKKPSIYRVHMKVTFKLD